MRKVEKIDGLVPVKNAVITVFDKSRLDILVPGLINTCPDIKIYSTGGTYKKIVEFLGDNAEKYIQEVSKYTGLPETEGGLVKTLHHKLFLGYLTEKYSTAHQRDLERENAVPIDLFVGNLYPFKQVIASENVDIEDARMNIDIGGPSALRAVAKNWHRVATLIDPNDYLMLLNEIKENKGSTTPQTRFELHKKVFRHTGNYDMAIADFVDPIPFEEAKKSYTILNEK